MTHPRIRRYTTRPSGSVSRGVARGSRELSKGLSAHWREVSFAEGLIFSLRRGALT